MFQGQQKLMTLPMTDNYVRSGLGYHRFSYLTWGGQGEDAKAMDIAWLVVKGMKMLDMPLEELEQIIIPFIDFTVELMRANQNPGPSIPNLLKEVEFVDENQKKYRKIHIKCLELQSEMFCHS